MAGMMGNPREARRLGARAARMVRRHRPRVEAFAWRSLAQAHRISGRPRRAERLARRALRLAERVQPAELEWCRVELGRVLAASGDWEGAGHVWGSPLPERQPAASAGAVMALALSGRAALRTGREDLARERLAAAQAWLRDRPTPHLSAFALLLRAEI